jgi:hypothetical protein
MVISSIDFNRVEVYEAGALLITLLAYPRERVWAQVHASLCSYALRIKSASEPNWATAPQPMKPIYAFRLQQDISRDLRTLDRRIRDRMIAGRMGIGFLKEAVTGQVPAGLKRLSINELAELVRDDARYSEPENVETRIWRPSLPVIHLATALQVLLYLGDQKIGPIGYESLLLGRNVIELIIRTAEHHRVLFTQSRTLRLDPSNLISIRLA